MTPTRSLLALVLLGLQPVVATAAERLPDLVPAPPGSLVLGREGDEFAVAFSTIAGNVGRGELRLEGTRRAGQTEMRVRQLVARTGGGSTSHATPARMRFARDDDHGHWHTLRFASFELRALPGGARVAAGHKSGFCLGDRLRAPFGPRGGAQQFRTNCALGAPGARRVVQGISPGWADIYSSDTTGQTLSLAGLPPGRYAIVQTVDPGRALRQADRRNDRSWTAFELRRPEGTRPVILPGATCSGEERCAMPR